MNINSVSYTSNGVPIIDFHKFTINDDWQNQSIIIQQILRDYNCFLLTNYGQDLEKLIFHLENDAKQFFKLAIDKKLEFSSPDQSRGYSAFQTQNVHAFMGRFGFPNDPLEKLTFGQKNSIIQEKTENCTENMEFFNVSNIYPDYPSTLERNVDLCYEKLWNLSNRLKRIFSMALDQEENFISEISDRASAIFKLNYYPVMKNCPKSGQDRLAEHTDGSLFTIVLPDHENLGLQIKVQKLGEKWITIDCPKSALLVNVGDCLARFTNDQWKSLLHKVVFMENDQTTEPEDRFSFAYFVQLNLDTVLKPLDQFIDQKDHPALYKEIIYQDMVNDKIRQMNEGNKVYDNKYS